MLRAMAGKTTNASNSRDIHNHVLAHCACAQAEGAAEDAAVRTRRRVFGEERTVDPTQIGVSRVIGEGSLFVLGDCEARSVDSRVWGPLAESRIVARPVVRIWPLDRMGDIDNAGDAMSTGEMGNFRRAMVRWRQALDEAVRLPPPDTL